MSKRIVITGVSRGLGRAMATELLRMGHRVFGCATNRQAIEDLSQCHENGDFQAVDISDADRVKEWAKRVINQGGPPDLLLNNAAIINRSAALWEIDPAEFEALLRVNVGGTFHTIKHFLPAMAEAGTGVVVNFSSGWGRSTSPEVVPYCASKFAIEGLSAGLAKNYRVG